MTFTPLASGSLKVAWTAEGDYTVLVDGVAWLKSAPTTLQCSGQHHSTADATLKPTTPPSPAPQPAFDKLGWSNVTRVEYGMRDTYQTLVASVRTYKDIEAAVFSQVKFFTYLRPVSFRLVTTCPTHDLLGNQTSVIYLITRFGHPPYHLGHDFEISNHEI